MGTVQASHYCATCQRQTLHTKPRINNILHLILSVLTLGIWAVLVWIPLGIKNRSTRTRCMVCGTKPSIESLVRGG